MESALQAWVRSAALHGDAVRAAEAAAEAVAANPWDVVQIAGALARAEMQSAPHDLGLTPNFRQRPVHHPNVVIRIEKGAPFPSWDAQGKKHRGAFDTPSIMARETVRMALEAAQIPVRSGLDPACGTGAFLVALSEAGIKLAQGFELDERAAIVAQIAAPSATVVVGDGFTLPGSADVVVGNPPFIPPERQDKALRTRLKQVHPWLRGRFDIAVPFAATAVQRTHTQGGTALVLPASLMTQPYGLTLRQRWLQEHHIRSITHQTPFPGAAVQVVSLSLTKDAGPAPLPRHGVPAQSVLSLQAAPLNPQLRPGDPELVARIRSRSVPLGTVATVDTGVVSHGSKGGKAALVHDTPTPERVPYVDARDLIDNKTRWLDYQPEVMHRAKSPALFEQPKVLVQRLRGRGPIRAWVDRSGLYAGHTLTVIRPDTDTITPETIYALITDPLIDGLIRIENGSRLDLYPKDIRGIPIPKCWRENPELPLAEAWGLTKAEIDRLSDFHLT